MIDPKKFDTILLTYPQSGTLRTVNVKILAVEDTTIRIEGDTCHEGRAHICLVNSSPDPEGGYEGLSYMEIEGTLKDKEFSITGVRDHTVWREGFFSTMQQLIPDGIKFLMHHNKNLYRRAVEENSEVLVTASAGGGGLRSQKVGYEILEGDKIRFSLGSLDPVLHHIKVAERCNLIFDPPGGHKGLRLIEVSGRAILEKVSVEEVTLIFEPERMQYGKMTELETYRLQQENVGVDVMVSVRHSLRFVTGAWRLPLALESLFPYVIGSLLGSTLDLQLLVLAGIALFFLQLGSNLLNDFFDHKSKNDEYYYRPILGVESPHGSSRFIQHGLLTPSQALVQATAFVLTGGLIGIYLNFRLGGVTILILGIVGVILAVFYTAPPIKLAHRGLGEVTIVTTWSVLPFLGGYYLQTRSLTPPLTGWIGVAVLSALTFIMVVLSGYMDVDADRRAGKKTILVMVGRERTGRVIKLVSFVTSLVGVVSVLLCPLPYPVLLFIIPLLWLLYTGRVIEHENISVLSWKIYLSYIIGGIIILLVEAVI